MPAIWTHFKKREAEIDDEDVAGVLSDVRQKTTCVCVMKVGRRWLAGHSPKR